MRERCTVAQVYGGRPGLLDRLLRGSGSISPRVYVQWGYADQAAFGHRSCSRFDFGFPAILGCAIAYMVSELDPRIQPNTSGAIILCSDRRLRRRSKSIVEAEDSTGSPCPEFRLGSSRRIAGFLGMVVLGSV